MDAWNAALWSVGGGLTGLLAVNTAKCQLNRMGNELDRSADYAIAAVGLVGGVLAMPYSPFVGGLAMMLGFGAFLDSQSKISDHFKPLGVMYPPHYNQVFPMPE